MLYYTCIHDCFLKYKTTDLLFYKSNTNVQLQFEKVSMLHMFLRHFLVSVCIWVCASKRHTHKKRDIQREGERRNLQEEKKPKFRQHMFLGRPLLSVLDERRDTLTVSCSSGLAPHLSRWSFLAMAAIFISVRGKF